jgi:hypothetical protein
MNFKLLIILFAISLLIAPVAADSLIVMDAYPSIDDMATVDVRLSATNGLSGYNITFTVDNPAVARIYSVSYPVWVTLNYAGSTPATSVTVVGVDLGDAVSAPLVNEEIAYLTIDGLTTGTTTITATVNQIDDDIGGSVTPSVVNCTVTVGSGTVSGSGSVLPVDPFTVTSNANVDMVSATGSGNNEAELVALISNTTLDASGWFVVGMASGQYAYYSNPRAANETGYYTETITGIPLMPGNTYYVRACTANGRGSTEKSFTLLSVDTAPTATFGVYWQEIQSSDKSPATILYYIPFPLVAALSGAEGTLDTSAFGWSLWWFIIVGIACVSMWLRTHDATTVVMTVLVTYPVLAAGAFIPDDFKWIAIVIASVAIGCGVFYYILKRD